MTDFNSLEDKDNKIVLEDLEKIASEYQLGKNFVNYMLENAIFCLESQGHETGIKLSVKLDNNIEDEKEENKEYELIWSTKIEFPKNFKDEKRTTDFGAMFIALLLILKLKDNYNIIEASEQGTGYDFLLSKDSDDLAEDNFLELIGDRLEVSGIRKEIPTNNIETRTKQKIKQTDTTDYTNSDAYIVVVEFSKPKSVFYHKKLK